MKADSKFIPNSRAKYKIGDWLTADDRVYMHIVGYVDGSEPIYAVEIPNHRRQEDHGTSIGWQTEFELEEDDHVQKTTAPDFARYAKLEAGDTLHIGHGTDRPYISILARTGDMVLLSQVPQKEKIEQLTRLSEQIKELSDGQVDPIEDLLDDEDREQMKKAASPRYARRVASHWKSTEWLAWMNWPVVEE